MICASLRRSRPAHCASRRFRPRTYHQTSTRPGRRCRFGPLWGVRRRRPVAEREGRGTPDAVASDSGWVVPGRRIRQVPGAVTSSSLASRERSSETRSVRVPLPWPARLFGCAFRCRHGTRRDQKYHVLPSEAARGPLSQSPPHAPHRAHVRTLATAADRAIMRAPVQAGITSAIRIVRGGKRLALFRPSSRSSRVVATPIAGSDRCRGLVADLLCARPSNPRSGCRCRRRSSPPH